MSADRDWDVALCSAQSHVVGERCGIPSFAKAAAKVAKDGIYLAGLGSNGRPKQSENEPGGSVHGNEIVGFTHAGKRKRVWPFEMRADAVGKEGLGLGGVGEFDDGQKHAELGPTGIDGHVRCYGNQRPNSCFQYADGAPEEVLCLAALGIGDKWLAKKIMLHIGEGDVAAFERIFIWLDY